MAARIVTLLTDFGLTDAYVAAMKGVILDICPAVRIVDISHLISPQDIRSGAYVLYSAYRHFPAGTTHLAVVDPGVGTTRRSIAVRTSRHAFVGPDNGLFSWILGEEPEWEAWALEDSRYWRPRVSKTFHGRDVFAPTAAHLACGTPPEDLGRPCTPEIAPWIHAAKSGDAIEGEVIHIDHFGNCITNITAQERTTHIDNQELSTVGTSQPLDGISPDDEWLVHVGEYLLRGTASTYSTGKPGSPMAIIGSSGHLEIAVNLGNAAKMLGIESGTRVSVTRPKQ